MSMSEGRSATVTVGAAMAEALARAGVKFAFTVPSESLLGLLDGLAANKIRIVAARHEGAASFMAEAVAQLTGRPTLVLAGRAPGAANLAIGLHAAHSDSAPVIAIVGQVRRDVLGREAFQEMDLVRTFEPMVKWAVQAQEPGEVAAIGEKAVATALKGRPGPVLVSVPEDLFDMSVPVGHTAPVHVEHPAQPEQDSVRKVLHLLLDARRPLIVAGAGVLRARSTDALIRFAETVQVPVVASWRRADVFPNDHALYLGMAGLGAPASVRARLEDADALLVLGCRMGEMTSYGYTIPGGATRWAHVDAEPRGAGTAHRPDIGLTSDAAAFLRVAQRVLSNAALDAAGLDERRLRNAADREAYDESSGVVGEPWDGPGVHPGRVIATLGRVLPADAIVATDAGDFGTWAARGYRFHRPGTFVGPTSGAMGFALPAAIAASLARPGRMGVALAGDGGFAMTMAELETAVRERAHVVAVVFDNKRYGTIWRHQRQRGGPGGLATALGAVDFAAIAEACGALGIEVTTDEEFEPALRQAIQAGRPALLHLTLDPRWTLAGVPPTSEVPLALFESVPVSATEESTAQETATEESTAQEPAPEQLEDEEPAGEESAPDEAAPDEAAPDESAPEGTSDRPEGATE